MAGGGGKAELRIRGGGGTADNSEGEGLPTLTLNIDVTPTRFRIFGGKNLGDELCALSAVVQLQGVVLIRHCLSCTRNNSPLLAR